MVDETDGWTGKLVVFTGSHKDHMAGWMDGWYGPNWVSSRLLIEDHTNHMAGWMDGMDPTVYLASYSY